ncbi:hypothetical protein DAMA08_041930 [Martiniozyma asiatica (nom. inval.)]|nr:hypothetical protein DAMA08_041930 [Martiniozyma asiatica]
MSSFNNTWRKIDNSPRGKINSLNLTSDSKSECLYKPPIEKKYAFFERFKVSPIPISIDECGYYELSCASFDTLFATSPGCNKYISKIEYLLYMLIILRAYIFDKGGTDIYENYFDSGEIIRLLSFAEGLRYHQNFEGCFNSLGVIFDNGNFFVTKLRSDRPELFVDPHLLVKPLQSVYYSSHSIDESLNPHDEQLGFEHYKRVLLTKFPSWKWLQQITLNDNAYWKDILYTSTYDFDDPKVEHYLYVDEILTGRIETFFKMISTRCSNCYKSCSTIVNFNPWAQNYNALIYVYESDHLITIKASRKYLKDRNYASYYKLRTPEVDKYNEFPEENMVNLDIYQQYYHNRVIENLNFFSSLIYERRWNFGSVAEDYCRRNPRK